MRENSRKRREEVALTSLPVPVCCHPGNLASWTGFVSPLSSLPRTREPGLLRPSALLPTLRLPRPRPAPAARAPRDRGSALSRAGCQALPRGSRGAQGRATPLAGAWSGPPWASRPPPALEPVSPPPVCGEGELGAAPAGRAPVGLPSVPPRTWGWKRQCPSCARSLKPPPPLRGLGCSCAPCAGQWRGRAGCAPGLEGRGRLMLVLGRLSLPALPCERSVLVPGVGHGPCVPDGARLQSEFSLF